MPAIVPLLLTVSAVFATEEQKPLPTTFFIVRHAEKDAQENLNQVGKDRAKALQRFLANQNIKAIYSTDFARTRDTAKPTADVAKVTVQKYEPNPKKAWFEKLRTKHPGQNVLIVGHSNTVVPIVNGLGAKLKYKVGYDEYHNLFIVRVQGGIGQAVRINYGAVPAPKPVNTKKKKAVATP